MITKQRSILLLALQLLLVCSIAGKYLYERETRPRVWVPVDQFDPDLPFRGRYIALTPLVNACPLPHDKDGSLNSYEPYDQSGRRLGTGSWHWRVTTYVRDGKLVLVDARKLLPRSETEFVEYKEGGVCAAARLGPPVELFIPEGTNLNLPSKTEGTVWLEVTVPPKGPLRAIQLATSVGGQWKVLKLN